MNISLTPELEKLVQMKVASGLYVSASEVVREALRLLEERVRFQVMKLEELREEIQFGIDQADRGEAAPLDVHGTLAKVRSRRISGKGRSKDQAGPRPGDD
jgi:antitoxin ParD1/3/4